MGTILENRSDQQCWEQWKRGPQTGYEEMRQITEDQINNTRFVQSAKPRTNSHRRLGGCLQFRRFCSQQQPLGMFTPPVSRAQCPSSRRWNVLHRISGSCNLNRPNGGVSSCLIAQKPRLPFPSLISKDTLDLYRLCKTCVNVHKTCVIRKPGFPLGCPS